MNGIQSGFRATQKARQFLAALEERACVLAFALRHTHRLGGGIALGAQSIGLDLHLLAPLLERSEGHKIEREAAPRQIARNTGRIGTKQFRIQHESLLLWLSHSSQDRRSARSTQPANIP